MKVWELIAELSKQPAGDDVSIGNSHDSYLVNVGHVKSEDGGIFIYGDGKYCVTEEDENPAPAVPKSKRK
jgi:hypothetical protein